MKRRYIALLVFLLVALVFVSVSHKRTSGTTFSPKGPGVLALFLLFEESGFNVSRLLEPFDSLDTEADNSVLFLISIPKFGGGSPLLEWVKKGNRLVLMGAAAFSLEGSLAAMRAVSKEIDPDYKPLDPSMKDIYVWSDPEAIGVSCPPTVSSVCAGVERISRSSRPLLGNSEGFEVVAGAEEGAYVLHAALGSGDVWVFADDLTAINDEIDRHDNLRFLYQLASGRDAVLFDEFHHGYTAPASPHVRARRDAAWVLIALLAALMIVSALSRAVRFGPPLPEPEMPVAATAEFASVLGLLYRDHGASGVLGYYLRAWRQRCQRKFGVSLRLGDDTFLKNLESRGAIDSDARANVVRAFEILGANNSAAYLEQEQAWAVEELERVII